MGSADLMPRNLDHRVEVLTPVEDPELQTEIDATLEALWRDTAGSFELDAKGNWTRVRPKKDERPRSGQNDPHAAGAAAALARPRADSSPLCCYRLASVSSPDGFGVDRSGTYDGRRCVSV